MPQNQLRVSDRIGRYGFEVSGEGEEFTYLIFSKIPHAASPVPCLPDVGRDWKIVWFDASSDAQTTVEGCETIAKGKGSGLM